MKKILLIITFFLTTAAFIGCDLEDKYVNVCGGKYGSDQIIDSLVRRYHFNNPVYFAQLYKDYLAPKHPNCDTIKLVIQSDTIPFSHNDTFAISVAKVFFNDSVNKEIKVLKIEVIDYRPTFGKIIVNFAVSRSDLKKNYTPTSLVDTTNMKYEIIDETPYTAQSASENWKGMTIHVNIKEDYQEIQALAASIKTRYDSIIKADRLSELKIDMIVSSPTCKLCTDKTYNFFYDQRKYDR